VFEGHLDFLVVVFVLAVVHHGSQELSLLHTAIAVHVHALEDQVDLGQVFLGGLQALLQFLLGEHAVPVLVHPLEYFLELLEFHLRADHGQLGLYDLFELGLVGLLAEEDFLVVLEFVLCGGRLDGEPLVIQNAFRRQPVVGVQLQAG